MIPARFDADGFRIQELEEQLKRTQARCADLERTMRDYDAAVNALPGPMRVEFGRLVVEAHGRSHGRT